VESSTFSIIFPDEGRERGAFDGAEKCTGGRLNSRQIQRIQFGLECANKQPDQIDMVVPNPPIYFATNIY
jgi:hypothetical protein